MGGPLFLSLKGKVSLWYSIHFDQNISVLQILIQDHSFISNVRKELFVQVCSAFYHCLYLVGIINYNAHQICKIVSATCAICWQYLDEENMCGFKPRGFVLRPFYFRLQTLPNLRHAVTIFALGMRLRSRRKRGGSKTMVNQCFQCSLKLIQPS